MFILYAIVIGLAIGFLLGGRLSGLAELHIRWAPLAIGGLTAQLILFSPPAADVVGDLGPPLYVASTLVVLVAVIRNLGVPGFPLIALGAALNLAAILANGGTMPADPAALAMAGFGPAEGFSNSSVVESPAVRPLTDIFALPAWVPLANVFSIGDVLIGVGIAWTIAAGMRGSRTLVTPGNSHH